jgi:hypothetical protein
VVVDARFCKECGAPLEGLWPARDFGRTPLIAAALSVVPGLGHVYRGHLWKGLAWLVGIAAAYATAQPLGFVLHLVCAANAALAGVGREHQFNRVSRTGRSRAWSRP